MRLDTLLAQTNCVICGNDKDCLWEPIEPPPVPGRIDYALFCPKCGSRREAKRHESEIPNDEEKP